MPWRPGPPCGAVGALLSAPKSEGSGVLSLAAFDYWRLIQPCLVGQSVQLAKWWIESRPTRKDAHTRRNHGEPTRSKPYTGITN